MKPLKCKEAVDLPCPLFNALLLCCWRRQLCASRVHPAVLHFEFDFISVREQNVALGFLFLLFSSGLTDAAE